MRLERCAHLLLLPRERAHERRVLGRELRRVRNRGAVHRGAEELGELRRFGERLAQRELLAGEDRGPLRRHQHVGHLA